MKLKTTDFYSDIQKGKTGEQIFIDDFLNFLNIQYNDVTGCQKFQIIDSDFVSKIGVYEIKLNYKDDNKIIIEEYTNINPSLSKISLGWFYKSKADILIFISKETRVMIMIPFNEKFKKHYENIKNNFELTRNFISTGRNGNQWQSAYRKIDLNSISGFYSKYKRK